MFGPSSNFSSVLHRTTEAPPEPLEPAAEAAVGHTASINVFNVVYEVYRTHNPEAEAVTTSYKYTQVWHVHVEIQELVNSCWWGLCMFDGQGPGENFGQHFWQVNVRAFALRDPTVLYLLVAANRPMFGRNLSHLKGDWSMLSTAIYLHAFS